MVKRYTSFITRDVVDKYEPKMPAPKVEMPAPYTDQQLVDMYRKNLSQVQMIMNPIRKAAALGDELKSKETYNQWKKDQAANYEGNRQVNASMGITDLPSVLPEYGLGNIDLHDRPKIKNPDGSISTVYSMTFQEPDGSWVLVPGVRQGLNRTMTDEEAYQWYKKSGEHLGKFKTLEEADKYAEQLHKDQEDYYSRYTPDLSPEAFTQDMELRQLTGGQPERSLPERLYRKAQAIGEGMFSWVPEETRKIHGLKWGVPEERLEEYARPFEPEGIVENLAYLGGELFPIGGIQKAAGTAVAKTVLPRVAPKLVRPIEVALAGGAYEGGKAALKGEPLSEAAKEAAIGAVEWPLIDLGFGLAIKGVGKAAEATGADKAARAVIEKVFGKQEAPKMPEPEFMTEIKKEAAEEGFDQGRAKR